MELEFWKNLKPGQQVYQKVKSMEDRKVQIVPNVPLYGERCSRVGTTLAAPLIGWLKLPGVRAVHSKQRPYGKL